MGSLSVITAILAMRVIVLVAVLGGVVLTFVALGDPTPYKLGALAIYGLGVVIPSIWLAGR